MRVLHCVATLDPTSGGPARSVPQLALAQAELGLEVGMWSPAAVAGGLPDLTTVAHAKIRVCSGAFSVALKAFGTPDVVHDHGIWLPCHREVARVCRQRGIPRMVSPRGMLEPWALNHKKWKKKLAWWLYQKRDLQRAAALHATAAQEAEQLRKLGFRQRIIVAPNGVGEQDAGVGGRESGVGNAGRALANMENHDDVDVGMAGGCRGSGVGNAGRAQANLENDDEVDSGMAGGNRESAREVPADSLSDSRPPTPDPQSPAPAPPIRTALFLSRIHPKKGLPLWLEAWARVRPAGWRLQIVGPDEAGHTRELQRLCDKLGLGYVAEEQIEVGSREAIRESGVGRRESAREVPAGSLSDPRPPTPDPRPLTPDPRPPILFSGPIEGHAKWELMRAADLFVLPTHSENFGIVVAEALACGVPVITTTGAPWAGLLEQRCGWWVDVSVEALAGALEAAIRLTDEERSAMGKRGIEWVRAEFAWEGIARRIVAGYEEVLGR